MDRECDHHAWCELVNRFSRYVYGHHGQGHRLRREHLGDLRDAEAVRSWIERAAARQALLR